MSYRYTFFIPILTVCLSVFWANSNIFATTRTVDAGGGADHTTISAAVTAASAGDTILVLGSATYNESVSVTKPLTFIAQTPGGPTVNGGSDPAFTASSLTGDITIKGFNLDRNAKGTPANDMEGAVFFNNVSGKVIITKNAFISGYGTNAIAVFYDVATNSAVIVEENTATGAVSSDNARFLRVTSGTDLTVVVNSNIVSGLHDDGVFLNLYGTGDVIATITDNEFTGFNGSGEGIDVEFDKTGGLVSALIADNTIDLAGESGDGIILDLDGAQNANFSAIVDNNQISNTGEKGIEVDGGSAASGITANILIKNNTINTTSDNGMELRPFSDDIGTQTTWNVVIDNNSIDNPNTGGHEAGIYIDADEVTNDNYHLNIEVTNNTLTSLNEDCILLDANPSSGVINSSVTFTQSGNSCAPGGSFVEDDPTNIATSSSDAVSSNDIPASLGDFVWNDLDGEGDQDGGEPGVGGVSINITGTQNVGGSINFNTVSNADGEYFFPAILPGTYTLTITVPAEFTGLTAPDQTADHLDSDFDSMTNTVVAALTASRTNVDAGLLVVPSCNNPAIVSAGNDTTIDQGTTALLNGSITGGAATGTWTSLTGGGPSNFTPNNTTLNATYNPTVGEEAGNQAILVLTSDDPDGAGPCTVVRDTMVVTIQDTGCAITVTVDAGNDTTIGTQPPNDTAFLNGSVSSSGPRVAGTWSTSGDGTFFPNISDLNAKYVPGPADTIDGSVQLVLEGEDPDEAGPCTETRDTVLITIQNVDPCMGDTEDPEANCQNVTIHLNNSGMASIATSNINNGSTDNCGIETLSLDSTNFDCSELGPNVVVLTVVDSSSNSDTCHATVTVSDTTSPNAICHDITVYLDNSGLATITTDSIDNGSSDNCGTPTLSLDSTSFDCSELGANAVVLTATDPGNNKTDTCHATVTVNDTVSPAAICQNITIYLDGAGMASTIADSINNNSTDACGIETISLDSTNFDCSEVGAETVVLTVTDSSSNSDTCHATVTVSDTISPAAGCQNITIYLDGSGNATITATDVNNWSSDNCGNPGLSVDSTDFDCGEQGPNTVVLTATDQSNNSDTCHATVTVLDTLGPTVVCKDTMLQLGTGNMATLTPEDLLDLVNSFDNCGGPVMAMSLSQSTFGPDDVGKIIMVTLTAKDVNGNTSTCIAEVSTAPAIPTMGQWALFLFGLIVFTVFVVGVYNVRRAESGEWRVERE